MSQLPANVLLVMPEKTRREKLELLSFDELELTLSELSKVIDVAVENNDVNKMERLEKIFQEFQEELARRNEKSEQTVYYESDIFGRLVPVQPSKFWDFFGGFALLVFFGLPILVLVLLALLLILGLFVS